MPPSKGFDEGGRGDEVCFGGGGGADEEGFGEGEGFGAGLLEWWAVVEGFGEGGGGAGDDEGSFDGLAGAEALTDEDGAWTVGAGATLTTEGAVLTVEVDAREGVVEFLATHLFLRLLLSEGICSAIESCTGSSISVEREIISACFLTFPLGKPSTPDENTQETRKSVENRMLDKSKRGMDVTIVCAESRWFD